jgi:hypothetical protein
VFSLNGFDPQQYTDDEIIRKMTELNRKIIFANRFSLNFDMIGQLQTLLAALEFERHERLQRSMLDMRDKLFPDVIETDPGLKELEQNAKEIEKPKAVISGPEIRKSQRPVSEPTVDQGMPFRPPRES